MAPYMNCRYKSFVGISTGKDRVFPLRANLEELESKGAISHGLADAPEAANMLIYGSSQDCRELLLDDIAVTLKKYSVNGKYNHRPQAVYIRFAFDTNGRPLPTSHQKKVNKFSELCLRLGMNKYFDVDIQDDFGVLSVDLHRREKAFFKEMALASHILYIIRTPKILDWCVDYLEKTGGVVLTKLLLELSFQFLKNYDWGDGFNENVSLSFFDYAVGTASTLVNYYYYSHGPEEYAEHNFNISTLRDYVRKILIPTIGEEKVKSYNKNQPLDAILPVHRTFYTEFEVALQSLIISESR